MALPWLDFAVRHLRPRWVRNALADSFQGFERYALPAVLERPPGARVLVLAPHPDDESIGCGGSIQRLVQAGVPVRVCFLTDGAQGDPALRALAASSAARRSGEAALVGRRRAEARAALTVLGVAQHDFFDAPDGGLGDAVDTLAPKLAAVLDDWRPDTVLLPFLTDRHPDHHAASHCLAAAVQRTGEARAPDTCLGFELWSPILANVVVDIGCCLDIKRRAIACHASQLKDVDYWQAVEGLNRYRAVSALLPGGHAEAFHQSGWAAYRRLLARSRV